MKFYNSSQNYLKKKKTTESMLFQNYILLVNRGIKRKSWKIPLSEKFMKQVLLFAMCFCGVNQRYLQSHFFLNKPNYED